MVAAVGMVLVGAAVEQHVPVVEAEEQLGLGGEVEAGVDEEVPGAGVVVDDRGTCAEVVQNINHPHLRTRHRVVELAESKAALAA